ncbi:FAD/NAD(P)-binding domain-containing protein [Fomitopsis serialis]|uniref:FAD/NAD(P)-binding domain-containing protein n=1 Tax=Fomitopsis serialis TaxID=139415 RepID=UPI002007652A|nr:FAD/NAD(P)-binding domain-containing protein [Neoantrodia serialis]KAH9936220.1 FAD/NAD(P)-binding domain-containing protein [Neoantrodia serialis]
MKVAIVGSGVTGLAATWVLNEYSNHEVHLYEVHTRPGGHANTVSFVSPGRKPVDVDTYIVFNPSTYPNFLRFLRLHPDLKSRIQATDMTFSVSRDNGAFEWGGASLGAVFCQLRQLLDPDHWRMLYDVARFNACARCLLHLRDGTLYASDDVSIGEYLRREGYSHSFRDNYLIPMTAAIWSTPPDKCSLDFPARTLVQFMHNHHLLQIFGKPSWLTFRGGSQCYVNHILSRLPASQLHLSTRITSVKTRNEHDVEVTTASGERAIYDHVIFACHSDTALDILRVGGGVTPEEERILGAFKWNKNVAVLHYDSALMPKRRVAWSCWNYLTASEKDEGGRKKANVDRVSLTYWMNALQHIPEEDCGPVFVTLNPPFEPDPSRTAGRYQYEHPVLGAKAVRAQQEMPAIQGKRGLSFAGAWLKYGFHEDGFTSGMRAAAALLRALPSPSPSGRGGPTTSEAHSETTSPLPFEILDADRGWKEDRYAKVLALFFDVFEGVGLRAIVGAGLVLGMVGINAAVLEAGLDGKRQEVYSNADTGRKALKREYDPTSRSPTPRKKQRAQNPTSDSIVH